MRTWNGLQTVDQFIDGNSRVLKVYKQFYFRFSEISIYRLIVSLELILEKKKRKQLERLNERFVEVRANIQYLHVENMHETCECTMVIAVVLLLLLCSLMHAMVFDNNNNNIMWCARPFYHSTERKCAHLYKMEKFVSLKNRKLDCVWFGCMEQDNKFSKYRIHKAKPIPKKETTGKSLTDKLKLNIKHE